MRIVIITIKAVLVSGLLLVGLIALAVLSVVIFREDINSYLDDARKEQFGDISTDRDQTKYDYDCEIMDPVRVKFGDVFFTYPASLKLRLETVHPSPFVWKRYRGADPSLDWSNGELCQTKEGFVESYGISIPVTSQGYNEALSTASLSISESVRGITVGPYLGIKSDDPRDNPALNRLDLTGTMIDAAQCTPVAKRSQRLPRCRLWKEIGSSGIYINITLQPARPKGGFINDKKVYGKEDWFAIVEPIELSLADYISAD